eukprot:6776946-Pyramimonas_sp.AAC.1
MLAPCTFLLSSCKSLTGSHDRRTRNCAVEGFTLFEGATVTMIRGVEVPGMAFRHDSGLSRRNT